MADPTQLDPTQVQPDEATTRIEHNGKVYQIPNSKLADFKKDAGIIDTPAKAPETNTAKPESGKPKDTTAFILNGKVLNIPNTKVSQFKKDSGIDSPASNEDIDALRTKKLIDEGTKSNSRAVGTLEVGATMASGALAGVAGSIARESVREYDSLGVGNKDREKERLDKISQLQDFLTYQPKTAEGQHILTKISDILKPVSNVARKVEQKSEQLIGKDKTEQGEDILNIAATVGGGKAVEELVSPALSKLTKKVASITDKGTTNTMEDTLKSAKKKNDETSKKNEDTSIKEAAANPEKLKKSNKIVEQDAPKLYEKNADKAGIKVDKKDLRKKDPQETINVKKQKIGKWMNDNEIVDTSKKGTDQTIDMLSRTTDRLKVHGKSLKDNLSKLDAQDTTHKPKSQVLEQLNKDLNVDDPKSHFTPAQRRAVRQVKTWIENHGNVGKGEDRQITDNLKPTDIQSIIEDLNKQTQPFAGDTIDVKGAKEIYRDAYNSLREQLRDSADKADYHITLKQLEKTEKGSSAHITVEDLKQQYLKALDDYHNGKIVQDSLTKKAQKALNTATGKQKSMLEDLVDHSAIIIGSGGEHTGGLGALIKVPVKKAIELKNNFDYNRLSKKVNKSIKISDADKAARKKNEILDVINSKTKEARGKAPPDWKPPDDEPPTPKGPPPKPPKPHIKLKANPSPPLYGEDGKER